MVVAGLVAYLTPWPVFWETYLALLGIMIRRLNVIGAFRELGTDKQRRETMIALASTQLLVQLSSIPIALTIPSVARYFDVDVAQAAWLVIV